MVLDDADSGQQCILLKRPRCIKDLPGPQPPYLDLIAVLYVGMGGRCAQNVNLGLNLALPLPV